MGMRDMRACAERGIRTTPGDESRPSFPRCPPPPGSPARRAASTTEAAPRVSSRSRRAAELVDAAQTKHEHSHPVTSPPSAGTAAGCPQQPRSRRAPEPPPPPRLFHARTRREGRELSALTAAALRRAL
eukprot:363696-Chlamydomonas_euryale.AAC.24